MTTTSNLRIKNLRPLISPAYLAEEIPITPPVADMISNTRHLLSHILHGKDDRLIVVVGPCSIHDPDAAIEYASRLKELKVKFQEDLCVVMRVYFEKPRTTVGWKGLINDPHLDGSFDVNQGLRLARQLLLSINLIGIPTGSEFLDTIIPQYISDLVSWSAIGARTTESQIHRELASGLSMPVGFKNGTSGNIQIAVDAVYAAKHSHHFLGVTKDGLAAIVETEGNSDCHIILRGSQHGPNYDAKSISEASNSLEKHHLMPYIMVDCSHGNSAKDHKKQLLVVQSLSEQIASGNHHICGVMIESNLIEGKQALTPGKQLIYGQSITDACIHWDDTVRALQVLREAVKKRRKL